MRILQFILLSILTFFFVILHTISFAQFSKVNNAVYGGVNYFICQKFKLMAGVEYANMSGGDSTLTWLGGVRIFW